MRGSAGARGLGALRVAVVGRRLVVVQVAARAVAGVAIPRAAVVAAAVSVHGGLTTPAAGGG